MVAFFGIQLSLGSLVGGVCAGLAMVLTLINGTVMLLSPRRFFALPRWLRAQGTLTESRYSSGFGALQLRLLGAILVGGIVWLLFHVWAQTHSGH